MNKLTLTEFARLIKSEKAIVLLLLIIVGFLVLAIFSLNKIITKKPQEPRSKTPQIAWRNDILPGVTTKEELQSKLGNPIKTQTGNNETTYLYSSTNQYRPHEVEIFEDSVSLIKEQIIGKEKGSLNTYIQNYGQVEAILYGEHGIIAPGHFWGSRGLLVFGNDNDGTIIEIWYFKPVDLDSFLNQHPELKKQAPRAF